VLLHAAAARRVADRPHLLRAVVNLLEMRHADRRAWLCDCLCVSYDDVLQWPE
jgi:hypothetical protein